MGGVVTRHGHWAVPFVRETRDQGRRAIKVLTGRIDTGKRM